MHRAPTIRRSAFAKPNGAFRSASLDAYRDTSGIPGNSSQVSGVSRELARYIEPVLVEAL